MSLSYVLDASAVLAWQYQEPDWEKVEAALEGSVISAVNMLEVTTKAVERGFLAADVRGDLEAYGVQVRPLTAAQADAAAELRPLTRAAGLSLGDRACLALALELQLPVLTADRAWAGLNVGTKIELVR